MRAQVFSSLFERSRISECACLGYAIGSKITSPNPRRKYEDGKKVCSS